MEREREQADHGAMLRELNKNLNERMTENEDLIHQVLYSIISSSRGVQLWLYVVIMVLEVYFGVSKPNPSLVFDLLFLLLFFRLRI